MLLIWRARRKTGHVMVGGWQWSYIDKEDSHSSPIVSLRDGPEALLQRQGRECDTSIKVSTGSRSRWRALREAAGGRGADESPTVLPSRARFQRVGRQSVLYFSPFAPHLSRGVPYLQLDCFPTNLDRLQANTWPRSATNRKHPAGGKGLPPWL